MHPLIALDVARQHHADLLAHAALRRGLGAAGPVRGQHTRRGRRR
jgi:hypothetical protein